MSFILINFNEIQNFGSHRLYQLVKLKIPYLIKERDYPTLSYSPAPFCRGTGLPYLILLGNRITLPYLVGEPDYSLASNFLQYARVSQCNGCFATPLSRDVGLAIPLSRGVGPTHT